jgi:hypothetical protein
MTRDETFATDIICKLIKPDKANKVLLDLNEQQWFKVIDYKMDIDFRNKLKVYVPFVRYKYIDFRSLLPKKTKLTTMYNCIVVDTIVYGYKDRNVSSSGYSATGDAELADYLRLFLRFQKDTTSKKKEAFDAQSPTITVFANIANCRILENHYDEYKIIQVPTTSGRLAFIKLGDTVILVGQHAKEENGKYTVFTLDTLNKIASMATMPTLVFGQFFDEYESRESTIVGKLRQSHRHDQRVLRYVGYTVWFTDLEYSGHCLSYKNDILVIISTHKASNAGKFVCVDDHSKKTKIECETSGDVWDTRCVKHTDCPFYMRTTKPYRGGCDSGYCEMPVGVKSIGFTKYEISESSAPYCYGCGMSQSPEQCCKSQVNPEYAFPGDLPWEHFDDTLTAPCETLEELTDVAFQALFDARPLPLEDKIHLKIIDTAVVDANYIKESCDALLKQFNLERLKYRFGRTVEARVYEWAPLISNVPLAPPLPGGIFFKANVCIHQPEKESGKLIEYECRRNSVSKEYVFVYVRVMHSISEDGIAFYVAP